MSAAEPRFVCSHEYEGMVFDFIGTRAEVDARSVALVEEGVPFTIAPLGA